MLYILMRSWITSEANNLWVHAFSKSNAQMAQRKDGSEHVDNHITHGQGRSVVTHVLLILWRKSGINPSVTPGRAQTDESPRRLDLIHAKTFAIIGSAQYSGARVA
uniref:Uncharacterized protein n=1 Tax=Kwoniella bestiolae CBS 10118 TaxID=1296100 RepID=A0A1B9FX11_9TREE|nr:hypothetical protein I302_07652 [Kwoniella bestiolae CBS 10118]OCF23298.1 hypothetical protein I302_07652 [Kwoniella bestiolae CBS 10118]